MESASNRSLAAHRWIPAHPSAS